MRIEPLTHYVVSGFRDRRAMGPGLAIVARPTARLSAHGPTELVDALVHGRNIYAGPGLPSKFSYEHFIRYFPDPLQQYNPDLPERILILRQQRIGLMYTPRCASAKLVFWWLKQAGLLDLSLRFTDWSHDFETVYRNSREYIAAALNFDPSRNFLYKFVRHPVTRILSVFRHCLQVPDGYGILANCAKLSFEEFLELLQTTNYLENAHCLPQITAHEKSEKIKPIILKIEDGLDSHLEKLELAHGLSPNHIDSNPEVRQVLQRHSRRPRRRFTADPKTRIPVGRSPDYRFLVTEDIKPKIYELYRADFDAYGYSLDDAL
jgi:hypothetical protein